MATERKISKSAIVALCLVGALALCFMAYISIAYPRYRIPSDSMQPTLEAGDRIYGSRFAYSDDVLPQRGDIAIFTDARSGRPLMFRIAGLPGDSVQYKDGRLVLNGDMIAREDGVTLQYRKIHIRQVKSPDRIISVTRYKETLPGEAGFHYIYERGDSEFNDNRGPFTVPAGHVFFLGDNRDNAADSRTPHGAGFVPLGNIKAQAQKIWRLSSRCKQEPGLHCPDKNRPKEL